MRHLTPLAYLDVVARTGSIRKAAESLAITSTALNRRILALEDELGVPIFERLPRGVRLSTAGELLIHHIRNQVSDLEKVKSQISDLSGVRRGHVAIASTRAALPYFLPTQIARYRREHPAVTFSVFQCSREEAESALADHSADLALVFEPVRRAEFETLSTLRQRVCAVLPDDHPLAAQKVLRLRDCLQYPLALPGKTTGVRQLLELAVSRSSSELNAAIESEDAHFLINVARSERVITFDIPLGLSARQLALQGMVVRPLDPRDSPDGNLYLGQLRRRILPVAAAKFVAQLLLDIEAGVSDALPDTP